MGRVRFARLLPPRRLRRRRAAHLPSTPPPTCRWSAPAGPSPGCMGAYIVLFPSSRILTLVPLGLLHIGSSRCRPSSSSASGSCCSSCTPVRIRPASGGGVAWLAHVGGFVAGLALVRRLSQPRPGWPGTGVFAERCAVHIRGPLGYDGCVKGGHSVKVKEVFHAVVVGGGVSGYAAGVLLARARHRVAVVEGFPWEWWLARADDGGHPVQQLRRRHPLRRAREPPPHPVGHGVRAAPDQRRTATSPSRAWNPASRCSSRGAGSTSTRTRARPSGSSPGSSPTERRQSGACSRRPASTASRWTSGRLREPRRPPARGRPL